MPFGKWKNFDDCLNDPDNKKRYPSLETRKKICGSLQAKHKKDFDHTIIIEKYNKLKLEHPEFDERKLLEEVFSRITKDFQEDSYKLEFKRKEKDWGDEVLVDISLLINNKEVGGISYTYVKESSDIERTEWDVQIENFDVKPEYQRKGYGSLILKEALKEIDKKGLSIQLGATFSGVLAGGKGLNRENLINFYKRYGFKEATKEQESKYIKEYGTPLNKTPKTQITLFRTKKGKGKGWHGEPERHARARKIGKADFSFPETMQRSTGEGKIVKPKKGICEDCKKEKDLYYQKLCKECYLKRVKHYTEVYDLQEEKTLDMILFDITQEYDLTKDFANLTEDEAIRRIESHIPSGQTRLQKLWETQKLYEEARRKSMQLGIDPSVSPVQSVTVPFSITNTQTGKTMRGEVVENLDKNTVQLIPVSSTNVRASGQFKNELLVQFHPSKLQPMRTYRFMFETIEQAGEANKSLTTSGSPGRWVWQNLRGHTAGEKVVPSKLGPSLSPPGQGLPTIGGTSASLVQYKISNRVPVSRVKNFEEILKEMKRTIPNPITDPNTGSRIEALMGTRKSLREMKEPNWRKGTSGLPPIGDFVYVGNLDELEEDYKVSGHWRHLKSGKKTWIKEYEKGEKKTIEKEIPLWKRIKNKRKEYEKINIELEKAIEEERMGGIKRVEVLAIAKHKLRSELSIPKRKKWEQQIENFEDSLKWAMNAKKYYKKEIDQELKLKKKKGYKPNYTDFEWDSLLEIYQDWNERIEEYKEKIKETKEELKKIEEFEKELFEDKENIKYVFDITLHKKLKIQKGLRKQYPFIANRKINTINNAFYDLPNHLQDSCKQIRIFEKAVDDPSFGSLKSCGGFYDISEETITIGLKTHRKDISSYSNGFLKQTTVHEAAHALDFTTLTEDERYETMSFFSANYERLNNRREYAATNKLEFFAEGYTKLYMGDHNWFRGLTKGTKGFFQNIMKKYDFIVDSIMIELNEKINGIKFSYQDGSNHIFGVYRIPEDIFPEEADILVKEGKAQYENIDKYFELIKEKEVNNKNEKTTN